MIEKQEGKGREPVFGTINCSQLMSVRKEYLYKIYNEYLKMYKTKYSGQ